VLVHGRNHYDIRSEPFHLARLPHNDSEGFEFLPEEEVFLRSSNNNNADHPDSQQPPILEVLVG
jgi:hypothetical protein